MSVEAITWALKQSVPNSSTKFVLVVLANCASGDTFRAWPSIAYIASATGQDRKTVIVNLGRLVGLGLIGDTGERRGETRQVPVYGLNVDGANSTENGTVPKTDGNSPKKHPKQSQKRDTETSDTSEPEAHKGDRGRGHRLPADWTPSEGFAGWLAEKTELTTAQAATELDRFRDHWKAASGVNAAKRDWEAAFRNWCRTANERRTGNGSNRQGNGKESVTERVARINRERESIEPKTGTLI